uniref:DUF4220 domain-containing protein n=1 Tax=Aegilops tauschii TaxID=37682 RepID=N1QZE3_AEGTA
MDMGLPIGNGSDASDELMETDPSCYYVSDDIDYQCPSNYTSELDSRFVKKIVRQLWRVEAVMIANAILGGVIVGIGTYGHRYRHYGITRYLLLGATTLFLPITSYVITATGSIGGEFTVSIEKTLPAECWQLRERSDQHGDSLTDKEDAPPPLIVMGEDERQLLRCRFARYKLINVISTETLKFARSILLKDGQHEMAFKMIANELSFIHGYCILCGIDIIVVVYLAAHSKMYSPDPGQRLGPQDLKAMQQVTEASRDMKTAATHLSHYCAYLMASCPELLPDDDAWSKDLHNEVNAERALSVESGTRVSSMPPEARYRRLVELLGAAQNHEVLKDAAKLAEQLGELTGGEEMAWELLTRFWSE